MRILLTLAAYLGMLAVVAVTAFFAVIFLAGPHGGILPHGSEGIVLVLGWLAVLVIPLWTAWRVWKRQGPARQARDITSRNNAPPPA